MEVQSIRNIDVPDLLSQVQGIIDKSGKFYTVKINKQLLIDLRDVIKTLTDDGDDGKWVTTTLVVRIL